MAYSTHTLLGGLLVGVVVVAAAAGLVVAGGPGEARRQKEDELRLRAVETAAQALACYQREKGAVPGDLSAVDRELALATSEIWNAPGCRGVELARDPVTGDPFRLVREGGNLTQICAVFATARPEGTVGLGNRYNVIPHLDAPRPSAGEHCFDLNMAAGLD